MKIDDFPKRRELVVTKVKKILEDGAYVDLLEYPGKEGFVHITKVASKWVKNIRRHISEGDIKVGLVEYVDPERNIINISYRKVNSQMEKEKLEEYKREKRADKMFERICEVLGVDFIESYKKIAIPLIEEYGDLYSVFEALAYDEEVPLEEPWLSEFKKMAETIKPKEIDLKVEVKLKIPRGDGINVIKELFENLIKKGYDVKYIAAPKYMVKFKTSDYKEGENKIKKDMSEFEKKVKKYDGRFEYKRVFD